MPSNGLSGPDHGDPRLTAHLKAYVGAWPPRGAVEVVGSPSRLEPAWDGGRVMAAAVMAPGLGSVLSVPPDLVSQAVPLAARLAADSFRSDLAAVVGRAGSVSPWVVLRWSATPASLPEDGVWVESTHPALPDWLRAFPSPVLVIFDDDGAYLAGVGIKRHTRWGHELAVGTDPPARGRGLARNLVAQAARAVLAEGAMPLYVHAANNVPSARVADAAGFPDLGWRLLAAWAPVEVNT